MLHGYRIVYQRKILFSHHSPKILDPTKHSGEADPLLLKARPVDPNDSLHLHSESVISVHRVANSVGGLGLSKSSSLALSGIRVSNSSSRIPGLGP